MKHTPRTRAVGRHHGEISVPVRPPAVARMVGLRLTEEEFSTCMRYASADSRSLSALTRLLVQIGLATLAQAEQEQGSPALAVAALRVRQDEGVTP